MGKEPSDGVSVSPARGQPVLLGRLHSPPCALGTARLPVLRASSLREAVAVGEPRTLRAALTREPAFRRNI